jgi:putative hydrolase of the HAD superfamily
MNGIRNIIFDLGGVLLDIDFKASQRAFEQLEIHDFQTMVSLSHSNDLFHALETGLDAQLFYEQLRSYTNTNWSNEVLENAWCALLLGFRKKSIEQLWQLKNRYRIFLLSNTNEIHVQRFEKMFREQFEGRELSSCFEEAYYSNRIQKRKPSPQAWLHIMEVHALNPAETLFVDDGAANIEAAKQLGLQTIHLVPGMYIEELEW